MRTNLSYFHVARWLIGSIAAALIAVSSAVASEEDLCLQGCPVGAPATNRTISRSIYALSNNGETKFADWVAYKTTRATIGPTQKRVWKIDPDLPAAETLGPNDYKRISEVLRADRGHQAPLASFTGTRDWPLANYLSNITPQAAALNQGPWERLEAAERTLARESGVSGVFTLTGPLYEKDMPPLPESSKPHKVPSGYWKVVAIEQDGEINTAAFVFHQDASRSANFCNFATPIRDIEQRTKLDFFPHLSKSHQAAIETGPGQLLLALSCKIDQTSGLHSRQSP